MTGKTASIKTEAGFINIAPGPTEELSYFSLGEINSIYLNKEEVGKLTDALYAAQDLEVIPLRDELIAFARFNDPEGEFIEEVVDDYLASLEEEDVE